MEPSNWFRLPQFVLGSGPALCYIFTRTGILAVAGKISLSGESIALVRVYSPSASGQVMVLFKMKYYELTVVCCSVLSNMHGRLQ